jgi:hypothetical protein
MYMFKLLFMIYMIDTEINYIIFLYTAVAAHTRFPLLFFPTEGFNSTPPRGHQTGSLWELKSLKKVFSLSTFFFPSSGRQTRSCTRWLVLPHSGRLVAESTRCKDVFLWPSDKEAHMKLWQSPPKCGLHC